jgi:hypothetical protein
MTIIPVPAVPGDPPMSSSPASADLFPFAVAAYLGRFMGHLTAPIDLAEMSVLIRVRVFRFEGTQLE